MNVTPITIGLADDHQLFREGLLTALRAQAPAIRCVLEAQNGRDLINQLDQIHPQVILLDINMPELDGFETAAFIRNKYPRQRLVVLSSRSDAASVLRMHTIGVNAYLHKSAAIGEVITAVREVARHGKFFSKTMSTVMLERRKTCSEPGPAYFTRRETDVARLICQEYTTAEIADQLCLSPRTIETHRRKLIEKVGVRNTAGLVVYLVRQGVV